MTEFTESGEVTERGTPVYTAMGDYHPFLGGPTALGQVQLFVNPINSLVCLVWLWGITPQSVVGTLRVNRCLLATYWEKFACYWAKR